MARNKIIENCCIEGCDTLAHTRGLCQKHYTRARRNSTLDNYKRRIAPKGEPLRFLLKVVLKYVDEHNCLIWPYGKIEGYGTIRYKGKSRIVSRLVCRQINGKPPTRKHEACHSCGKGHEGCVNPHHLYWGTHAENMKDTILHNTTTQGTKQPNAVLTDKKVIKILSLRKKGWEYKELASRFGVSYCTIAYICQGKTWKHIERA